MATTNTIATLDGLYKQVYGGKLERIIPKSAKAQQLWPFSNKGKVGSRFQKLVAVTQEHGFTYAAPQAGAFSLASPVVGATAPAYVQPYQLVFRTRLAYDATFQAPSSGPQAFLNATQAVFETSVESIRRRLEASILGYGRTGLAEVDSVATNTITITDASWAPGIWVAAEGALIEAFNGVTGTDVQRSYTGTGTSYTITAVDLTNKTITVDDATNITGGDILFFYGQREASSWNDMIGLDSICTTSGTLFGINNATYSIFKGTSKSAGSTDLSFDTVLDAAKEMFVRGSDGDLRLWISPETYTNTVSDLSALVRYDQSGKMNYHFGSDMVKYYSPTGATITIEAHPMVKEGEGFLFEPKAMMRSGATDVTFNRAKMYGVKADGDNFFTELADNAGYEIRAYSNQFMFTHKPACFCKITNIVNS